MINGEDIHDRRSVEFWFQSGDSVREKLNPNYFLMMCQAVKSYQISGDDSV